MAHQTLAVKRGSDLAAEIRSTEVPHGKIALWWLGQATFAIKLGKHVIYTDPFYRAENEEPISLQEMPLKPHEFSDASIICCTHEHLDHIDPKTLPGAAAASPKAPVIIPNWTREMVVKAGVPSERLHPLRGDDVFEKDGIRITAIPAAHMTLDRDEQRGFRYLGYVIEGNGVTLYHAGDTQPYPGWYERVSKFKLDIALLPISGVDNLSWHQAVFFCALHRPKLAIPIHYCMFKGYTEDPQKFVEGLSNNAPEQAVKILETGGKFVWSA